MFLLLMSPFLQIRLKNTSINLLLEKIIIKRSLSILFHSMKSVGRQNRLVYLKQSLAQRQVKMLIS